MEKVIQVALVDDQTLFREGMKLVLSTFPELEVCFEAGSGLELMELLETGLPDIILLDYTMPEMDGFEAMKKVREKYPEMKIIILTMHFDEELMAFLMQSGANGYLLKDEESTTVKEAIIKVMEEGQFFPAYVSKALLKQLQLNSHQKKKAQSEKKQHHSFSQREKEILALVGKYNRQEMSDHLFISVKTVDFHLKNLRDKTQVASSAELVRYAIQHGYQS